MRVCVDFTAPSSADLFNETYMNRMKQIICDKMAEFEKLRKCKPTTIVGGTDIFTTLKHNDFYGIKMEEDSSMTPWSIKIYIKEDGKHVHTL